MRLLNPAATMMSSCASCLARDSGIAGRRLKTSISLGTPPQLNRRETQGTQTRRKLKPRDFSRESGNRFEETRRNAGGHSENDVDGTVARDGTHHEFMPPDQAASQTLRGKNVVGASRLGRDGKPQLISLQTQPGNRRSLDGDRKSGRAAAHRARPPVIRRAAVTGEIVQFE